MWINIRDKGKLWSDVELHDKVLADLSEPRLIVLDGPTMCGKTRFLKSLPSELTSISGIYLLIEDYVAGLERFYKDHDAFNAYKRDLIEKYRKNRRIICFEDVDMSLARKPATQEEILFLIKAIMEKDTVILTGIDVDRKCKELLLRYRLNNLSYYKWIET